MNYLKYELEPTETKKYLYGAYGSNLNMQQMAVRCPYAKPVGSIHLEGFELKFRGVADIQKNKKGSVALGLWEISDVCEHALDIYEGYPKLYQKIIVEVTGLQKAFGKKDLMLYTMNSKQVYPPSNRYLQSIKDGFTDFNLDTQPLMMALKDSYRATT